MKLFYDYSATTIDGKSKNLSDYDSKVILVVNTASQCGFTKQYAGLQVLYTKYKDQGFEILAFPCNQFLNQEPASNTEISKFCQSKFGISFQLFSKIDVNGENAHPIFKYLSDATPGLLGSKMIKWNFTKFLINRHGMALKRFSPITEPSEMEKDILRLLEE